MKITFSSEILLEFRDSIKFYESRRKGLGLRFSQEVNKSLNFILKNPNAAELKYKSVRVCLVKKFPFTIHYLVKNEECLVMAIFHTHRNPDDLIR